MDGVVVVVVVVAVDEVVVVVVVEAMVAADVVVVVVDIVAMTQGNRHKLALAKMGHPVLLSTQSKMKYQLQTEQQLQKKSKQQLSCRRCSEENI